MTIGILKCSVLSFSDLIGAGPEMTVLMLVWSYEVSAWGFKYLKSMDSLRKRGLIKWVVCDLNFFNLFEVEFVFL